MGRRIYVYRSGATDTCALTGVKDDPRLPPADATGAWQFWMQIGPHQAQDGRFGFNIRDAVQAIALNGYYLFTGSRTLLRERVSEPSDPSSAGNVRMPNTSRTAYLFRCEGEDLYAVSHDITGGNIPRSACTLGWRLCEEFQLGRHAPVPAPVMAEPIIKGISDAGYYVWRGWSSGSSKRPAQ